MPVIIHEPFMKFTMQQRMEGRMAIVDSICICRCGQKFSADSQLESHLRQPNAPVVPESAYLVEAYSPPLLSRG